METGNAILEEASDGTLRVKMDGLDENMIDPDDIYKGMDKASDKRKKEMLNQLDLDEMMDDLYGKDEESWFPDIPDDVEIIIDEETNTNFKDNIEDDNETFNHQKNIELSPNDLNDHDINDNNEKFVNDASSDGKKEIEMEDDGFIDDFEPHKVEYLGNGMTRSVIFDGGIINANNFLKEKFNYDGGLDALDESNNDDTYNIDNNNDEQQQDVTEEEEHESELKEIYENIKIEDSLESSVKMALSRGINSKDLENVLNALTTDNISITEKLLNERKKMDSRTNGRRKNLKSNKKRISKYEIQDEKPILNNESLVTKSDIEALYPSPIDLVDDNKLLNDTPDIDKTFKS